MEVNASNYIIYFKMEYYFDRNGADFGVFINTGLMYDGSDAGARISEAVSWGKMQV